MIKKLVFPFILAFIIALIVLFIAPKNFALILFFILLVSSLIFLTGTIYVGRKIGFITGCFIFLFMLLDYLIGFSLLNTIILISLAIALAILIK